MRRYAKKTAAWVLLMVSVLFILSSCSLFSNDNDDYLQSFENLEGSLWISTSNYNGAYDENTPIDFSSVVWSELEKSYSLAFSDKSKVFVGDYDNGVLLSGKYYSIDDSSKPTFLFSQESFVVTENYLNTKIPEADRQSFTQTDFAASAGGDTTEKYFISQEYSNGIASWSGKFHLLDEKTLIRVVIHDSDSKVALVRYTRQ